MKNIRVLLFLYFIFKQDTGVEPAYLAWEASALPID